MTLLRWLFRPLARAIARRAILDAEASRAASERIEQWRRW